MPAHHTRATILILSLSACAALFALTACTTSPPPSTPTAAPGSTEGQPPSSAASAPGSAATPEPGSAASPPPGGEEWFKAASARVERAKSQVKRGTCMGACDPAPALPKCAGGLATRSLAEVAASPARTDLKGQTISVRGPLQGQAGCTELGCPDDVCCNSCFGGLVLYDRGAGPYGRIELENAAWGEALKCTGDDQTVCCGLEGKGEEVVVTGKLGEDGSSPAGLKMTEVTLCAP